MERHPIIIILYNKMAPPTPTSGKRKKTDEYVVNNAKAKRGKKLTKEEKQAAMERAREWGAKQKHTVAAAPACPAAATL